MNNLNIKIPYLFKTYKWLLLPIIPLFILLIFLISLFTTSSSPPTSTTSPSPTGSTQITSSPTEDGDDIIIEGTEWEDSPESPIGYQKKETRPDGSIIYSFTSSNPNRPNITITTSDNQGVIFSRSISSEEYELPTIPLIKETYGEPERIIKGSKFYGSQAEIYIYASNGMAFIVNPQTEEAFEKHYFPPMSVDAYIQRFSD